MNPVLVTILNIILTPLIIGVAVFLYRKRRRNAVTVEYSYYMVLIILSKFTGTGIIVVSVLILLCAISDIIGHLGWDYPVWSVPIILVTGAFGYAVRQGAGWLLRQQERGWMP
jgi:hypothetical protein